MKKTVKMLLPLAILSIMAACNQKPKNMETELRDFISKFESTVSPMQIDANTAYWNASISGKDEDYAKAEMYNVRLNKYFTNKEHFELLKKFKSEGNIQDSMLIRELDVLYNAYLGNQVDTSLLEEKIKMETEVEKSIQTSVLMLTANSYQIMK
jgi:peptidyl-dipeptidase A